MHRKRLIDKLTQGNRFLANNQVVKEQKKADTVFLIEWDDTLFCSSFFNWNSIENKKALTGLVAEHVEVLTQTIQKFLDTLASIYSDKTQRKVFLVTG